jgi:hypothetical protein
LIYEPLRGPRRLVLDEPFEAVNSVSALSPAFRD